METSESNFAEEALRETEQEFSLAFEAARLGWWVWSEETGFVTTSEGTRAVLALPAGDAILSLEQFLASVHPEDRERVSRTWQQNVGTASHYVMEYKILKPDGTMRWVESRGRTFRSGQASRAQVVGVSMDITDRKRVEEELRRVGGRLIEAQEQERIRVARELHDDICQRLAILEIELAKLKRDLAPASANLEKRLDDLSHLAREVGSDIQALSHELHSSKLEILGTAAAMKSFCAEFSQRHCVQVDFTTSNLPMAVPKPVSICLYRIMQEALHNAFKHSRARHFIVRLNGDRDWVELSIEDSGVGFHPETAMRGPGLGLISMRERVMLINGTMAIESNSMDGTVIRARLPLEERLPAVSA